MSELSKKRANLSILPAYEFFAIEEKYKGIEYKQIVVKIKEKYDVDVGESTIKSWFWKNGKLKDVYRDYANIMTEIELEAAKDFIRGNVKKAAKVLAFVMTGKGNMSQVAAAKEFLERGLGKVKDEVDMNHSGQVTVGVLDILKAKKELEKQQDEQDTENN